MHKLARAGEGARPYNSVQPRPAWDEEGEGVPATLALLWVLPVPEGQTADLLRKITEWEKIRQLVKNMTLAIW